MLIKLLTKVFGSRNDRTLRRMRKVVNIINAMEPETTCLAVGTATQWMVPFTFRPSKPEPLLVSGS